MCTDANTHKKQFFAEPLATNAAAGVAKRARRQHLWQRRSIKDPDCCDKTSMQTNKYANIHSVMDKLYHPNGESRELPLKVLHQRHQDLVAFREYAAKFPVLIDEGAVTRSMDKKYTKQHAIRANKIAKYMPSIQKHLEALPLMLAEAEKQDAGADAVWTMQCDSRCVFHGNLNCFSNHKQQYVCNPGSPPYRSPCSD